MEVKIVTFPETRVAVVEHLGPPSEEHTTVRKLVAWKLEQGFRDASKYRHYALNYTNPRTVDPSKHRVEFCLSIYEDVLPNSYGVYEKTIPAVRCALATDVGSRADNQAGVFLYEKWLPKSGESIADFPIIFHYVNVGPGVQEHEEITRVYLPLQ